MSVPCRRGEVRWKTVEGGGGEGQGQHDREPECFGRWRRVYNFFWVNGVVERTYTVDACEMNRGAYRRSKIRAVRRACRDIADTLSMMKGDDAQSFAMEKSPAAKNAPISVEWAFTTESARSPAKWRPHRTTKSAVSGSDPVQAPVHQVQVAYGAMSLNLSTSFSPAMGRRGTMYTADAMVALAVPS